MGEIGVSFSFLSSSNLGIGKGGVADVNIAADEVSAVLEPLVFFPFFMTWLLIISRTVIFLLKGASSSTIIASLA